MNPADPTPITMLLHAHAAGDRAALDRLLPLVYDELRAMARGRLQRERAGHTLAPTELVHEAFMKLVPAKIDWSGRAHFYAIASRAMRNVLGEHTFATGDITDGMITADAGGRVAFAGGGERAEGLEIVQDGSITFRMRRIDRFEMPPAALRSFAGTYRATTATLDVVFDVRDGSLMMSVANVESVALEPISPVHFRPAPGAPIPPDVVVRFDADAGAVVLTSADFSLRAARVEAAERR